MFNLSNDEILKLLEDKTITQIFTNEAHKIEEDLKEISAADIIATIYLQGIAKGLGMYSDALKNISNENDVLQLDPFFSF